MMLSCIILQNNIDDFVLLNLYKYDFITVLILSNQRVLLNIVKYHYI